MKILVNNKKAKFNYNLLETFEAGLVLQGTEIKSLRTGKGKISEAFVQIKNGEAFVLNMYIPHFSQGNRNNHEERGNRKLLLHKKEIKHIQDRVKLERLSIVVTKLYLKDRKAKIEIALGKGKKLYDKRQAEKSNTIARKLKQGDYS